MSANDILAQITAEYGQTIANQAVRVANKARKNGTDAVELRRLAGLQTGAQAVYFGLAADLREAVATKR